MVPTNVNLVYGTRTDPYGADVIHDTDTGVEAYLAAFTSNTKNVHERAEAVVP